MGALLSPPPASGAPPEPPGTDPPPFREDGTLPPFRGTDAEMIQSPACLAPYRLSATELVRLTATSPRRVALLEGLLDHRTALRALAPSVQGAFQWLGGSFVERTNVEPHDIDGVTFALVHPDWLDARRTRLTDDAFERHRHVFDPGETRRLRSLDLHFVPANNVRAAIQSARCWYALLAHTKRGRWKGFVEVPLASDDEDARALLRTERPAADTAAASVSESEPAAVTRELAAYALTQVEPIFDLVTAPVARGWMDDSPERFAYRCLPLLLANQAGWLVTLREPVEVEWDGGSGTDAVRVFGSEAVTRDVQSHFGQGIVTFRLPWLFRTAPGYNLLARGPANWPKDGISPLEGLVETDWSIAPFTMSWKLTRPRHRVCFERGEPICMLVPQARGDLESFEPTTFDLGDDRGLRRRYAQWFEARERFLGDLRAHAPHAVEEGWQKDYFRGKAPEDTVPVEHQTRLHLRPFQEYFSRAARERDPSGGG